jgi:excisionase family DNA binding protein
VTERVTLTREEAAAALGIGVRTLQDWTRDGFIPSIRRGGIRLYSVDALRTWAQDRSEYDGAGEVSRGKASALGNGLGLSPNWGRPVGRRRQRPPTPLRKDRAGGAPDAG